MDWQIALQVLTLLVLVRILWVLTVQVRLDLARDKRSQQR